MCTLLLFCCLAAAPGQAVGPADGPDFAAPFTPREWEWRPDGQRQWKLLRRGGPVGIWDEKAGQGRWWRHSGNGRYTLEPGAEPPIPPPSRNYGVDYAAVGESRVVRNGERISPEDALRLVERSGGDKTVPDLSGKLRLTVIGPAADRAAVERDLKSHPGLLAWKDRVVAACYDPTHWHVADVGFDVSGRPTVYVQDPAGRVLHRQADYAGGPDALAKALGEAAGKLRKKDPDYDPSRDPDRRRTPLLPFLPAGPAGGGLPWSVFALAGAGAAVLLLRGRRGQ